MAITINTPVTTESENEVGVLSVTPSDPTGAAQYAIMVAVGGGEGSPSRANTDVTLGSTSEVESTKLESEVNGSNATAEWFAFTKADVDAANDLEVSVDFGGTGGPDVGVAAFSVEASGELSFPDSGVGGAGFADSTSITLNTDILSGDVVVDLIATSGNRTITDDETDKLWDIDIPGGVGQYAASKETSSGTSVTASYSLSSAVQIAHAAVAIREAAAGGGNAMPMAASHYRRRRTA